MKIGILTHFYSSTNFGGVLQAYALCKHLNDQGYSAEQILYKHHATRVCSSHMTCKDFFKKLQLKLTKELYRRQNEDIRKRQEASFTSFRDSIPHTQCVYTAETIGEIGDRYDALIAGSDQIWNPIWYDSAYMLHFAGDNTLKIAYAASIGLHVLDDLQKELFRKNIRNFDGISVREQTAAEILAPLVEKDVKVCVDPTLLLTADEWDEIASERRIKEKYIFSYFLGDDMKSRKTAERFADEKGMKLITIPDLLGKYRKSDRKIKAEYVNDATPRDFISLIKYAEYIFTDSFHACVFSLLYQKEFFAFPRSGKIKMESRIRHLTELFDCPQRLCADNDITVESLLSLDAIDYQAERKQLIKAKRESVDYLKEILNK